MSVKFFMDDAIVVVSAMGASTYEEVRLAVDQIAASPGLNKPARILFDVSHKKFGPPADELRMLAEHVGSIEAYIGSRWALLAPPDSHMYGTCRIFCSYAEFEGLRVETFSSRKDAFSWLFKSHPGFSVQENSQHNDAPVFPPPHK